MKALGKGKVEVAAAALRHHLEYVSRHLADQLGAPTPFRADGNYELGELLPSVLSRMNSLCGKAAEAAQPWGKNAEEDAAVKRRPALSTSAGASNVEKWAVNKAVHYNEWANFGRKDFEPVVTAFKELLMCFRCDDCDTWMYVTPRASPGSLRCLCNTMSTLRVLARDHLQRGVGGVHLARGAEEGACGCGAHRGALASGSERPRILAESVPGVCQRSSHADSNRPP
jgi:hypothetical protein